jgi:hypothetical protein
LSFLLNVVVYIFPPKILGTNYKEGLLKWIDEENLLQMLGGTPPGTIIDDIGPWSDVELCKQIGVSIDDLRAGKQLLPLPTLPASVSRRISLVPLQNAPSLRRDATFKRISTASLEDDECFTPLGSSLFSK